MGDTEISWTHRPGTRGRSWNCVKGCSRVSAGCQACYAERQAARIVRMGRGKPTVYDDLVRVTAGGEPRWTGKVVLDAKTLAEPLRWRQPSTVFANSMSDLFHESLANEQIAAVFGVMAACPQHTFQILTKRAKRMREWFAWARGEFTEQQRGIVAAPNTVRAMLDAAYEELGKPHKPALDAAWRSDAVDADGWPLPNCWLGVSTENQAAADERIPELLATPAAVRFLSCEPLLGAIDLTLPGSRIKAWDEDWKYDTLRGAEWARPSDDVGDDTSAKLDWVIAGCESGPGARPCGVAWLRSLRDQCDAAGVPFFLKQATQPGSEAVGGPLITPGLGSKRKPGGVIELPYLDGVQHAAFPEVRP